MYMLEEENCNLAFYKVNIELQYKLMLLGLLPWSTLSPETSVKVLNLHTKRVLNLHTKRVTTNPLEAGSLYKDWTQRCDNKLTTA